MPAPALPVDPSPVPPSAPPAARPAEHPVEVQTRTELVRMAFRELKGATISSSVVAIVFALVLGNQIPSSGLWIWLAGMLAVSGYRLWLAEAFAKANPTDPDQPNWGRRHSIAASLSGLGWGLSVWVFPTLNRPDSLGIIHVLILAGLLTGSARLLLPMRVGCHAYLLCITVPLAARFFAHGDAAGITVGGCLLFFTAYMAAANQRHHRALVDAILVRFEREALAEQLKLENARKENRESELREARLQAEAASRARSEFLTTISHEIRTPMNGVLGMLRIVRDTQLSALQRDYLKTASDSAERLLLLLNDVLDFNKIEAGQMEMHDAAFPPAAAAQTVADVMHTRARDKGLQFELKLQADLPGAILGDAARLRQILGNLIGNAIKFTEEGRIELAVTCAEQTDTRAVLHFTVTDTGIGIDAGALERLFKPFSQADSTLGRRYGGAGLGLAISRRLAEAMGGVLQVRSDLDQGTTLRLILPCALPEGTGRVVAPAPAPLPPLPAMDSRVLVVEDDAVNLQVIELFLRKFHIIPRVATDGESAVRLAATETFDLILMDCQLPGMDGLEATRQIRRKLAAGRPVRIVALTANTSRQIRESCLAAGMDDFLPKPIRLEALAEVLQRNPVTNPAG